MGRINMGTRRDMGDTDTGTWGAQTWGEWTWGGHQGTRTLGHGGGGRGAWTRNEHGDTGGTWALGHGDMSMGRRDMGTGTWGEQSWGHGGDTEGTWGVWGTGTWTRMNGAWGTWEESDGDTGTRKDTGTDRQTDRQSPKTSPGAVPKRYLFAQSSTWWGQRWLQRPTRCHVRVPPPHKVHGHPGVTAVPRARTRCPVEGGGRGGGFGGPRAALPEGHLWRGGDSRGQGTPGSLRSPGMGAHKTSACPPRSPHLHR